MPKKTKLPPAKHSDFGTKELRQHHTIVIEAADEYTERARNITQAPLDWYLVHGHISEAQWQAGSRMYNDFVYAGILHVSTTDFSQVIRGGGKPHDSSTGQIAARERFYKSLDQLEEEGQQLVLQVCCYGERPYLPGLPPRYALPRLKSALQELAVFFGFAKKGEKNV